MVHVSERTKVSVFGCEVLTVSVALRHRWKGRLGRSVGEGGWLEEGTDVTGWEGGARVPGQANQTAPDAHHGLIHWQQTNTEPQNWQLQYVRAWNGTK